jgi:hypothetical protein
MLLAFIIGKMEVHKMEIKRYLGFTDGIKEPRKTKVENELNRLYKYNGNIYNATTFLCVKLLEGCYPDKEENYQYYKRNGELSKPKTLYKFCNSGGKQYFELNKTQYDFVCYLLGKGLNTEESILAYDKADIENIESLQQAEQEEKARLEAEKQRKVEEKENFKIWMHKEAEKIPDFQKEIIDSIFFAIYGQQNTWNYTLAVCINNYNNPLCKEEVVARLHNDNKASIKIFECLTGLKLPKGYKERKTYLKSISVSDFKEAVDYKLRKKREEKEVQKEEFYINERTPEGQRWTKVIAEPFTKYGVDMFIRYNNGSFSISLAEAGMKVCDGNTKTECINKLKKFVDDRGKETFLQMVKEATEQMYKATGINPRYNVA